MPLFSVIGYFSVLGCIFQSVDGFDHLVAGFMLVLEIAG